MIDDLIGRLRAPRLTRSTQSVGLASVTGEVSAPVGDHNALANLGTVGEFPYDHDNVYLNKENTVAFTPDADYEPATKKYVDDNSSLPAIGLDRLLTGTGTGVQEVPFILEHTPGSQFEFRGAGTSEQDDDIRWLLDQGNFVVRMTNSVPGAMILDTPSTIASYFEMQNRSVLRLMDSDDSDYVGLRGGSAVTTYTLTLPLAAPGGTDYLLNADADGTMGWTDPATLGGAHPVIADDRIPVGDGTTVENSNASLIRTTSPNVVEIRSVTTDDTFAVGAVGSGSVELRPGATGEVVITDEHALRFREAIANGTEFVGLKAPPAVGTSYTVALPAADATEADSILANDSSGGTNWKRKTDLGITTRVFITDADNGGTGTVSSKTWEANTAPANKILTAFESDDDTVDIHLEMHVLGDSWQPADVQVVAPGGTPVTVLKQNWTQVGNSRVFTAEASLTDASSSGTITATMADGDTATVTYTRALDPPLILSVQWDNQGTNADPYPGVQTQFGNNQNMQISGRCESHADEVYIKDATASATQARGLQGPYTVTAGSWTATNVKSGVATNPTAHLIVYCKVTGGSNGPDFNSETDQTAATVACDQTNPAFGTPSVAYPAGQEAIKSGETVNVTLTHSNAAAGDTYLYDTNGTGELTIPSTTTYAATKTGVAYLAGSYRDSGTNYRLTATRTELNGHSATANATVEIANVAPVITMNTSSNDGSNVRLRTDDGTNNYKDHNIRVVSDQAVLSTFTPGVTSPVGTFQGSWSQQSVYEYRRDLRIADGDIVAGGQASNDYSWGAPGGGIWTNRAGTSTSTITTRPNFSVGGFETRTLTHPIAPAHEMAIGCRVVDTSKLTSNNNAKGAAQTFEANITHHNDADPNNNNFFTISNGSDVYDADGSTFHNSDQKWADTVSVLGSSTFDVEETV